MKEQFLRTGALIGEEGLKKLSNATVAVFGIGGVGSFAAEALVRSGVGTLYIYDNDKVADSNLNRQLIALKSTVGRYKTEVALERFKEINPDCNVIENRVFVTPQTKIPFGEFDYIIDAVDNVTAKLFLTEEATKQGVPIISVMGTGNKLDPTRIRVSDIYKTSVCPLARVMRIELKKRDVKKLTAVWTDETPIKPMDLGEHRETGRTAPSSMAFVPGTAGLTAASYVIKQLI